MSGSRPAQRVVITGASSGLGAELALAYARRGAELALIGRDAARLGVVVAACEAAGASVTMACIDVRDAAGMADFLSHFDATAPVDLVIANAGIAYGTSESGALETREMASLQVEINLLGTINTLAPLLGAMRRHRRGQIAVISSVAGYRGLPDSPAYCASKAAIRVYGESLRAALRPDGVAVSVVLPGFFASPMSGRYIGAQPMAMSTAAAARCVIAGLDRRQGRIVFPRLLGVLLQIADLLPAKLGDAIMHRFRFHIAGPELPTNRP